MSKTLPPLPEPDVCVRNDFTGEDVYSHSDDQLQAYAIAAIEAQGVPDDDGDLLTIAYLHGFAKGKDAASAPPAPQAKPQPLSDEQIVPMFRRRVDMPVEGEKDPWFWYAWGIEDGEAAHGIKGE